MFFSINTSMENLFQVTQGLRVRISSNSEKYLGLLNMVGRNKKAASQVLKDRLKKRIDS